MRLDFKGLITKEELNKDINKLGAILKEHDYAIVIDDGVGKFVVFDIDFATNMIEVNKPTKESVNKSNLTLVESMILTLEEHPQKKATAIELSTLVATHYGRNVSPVIIRARAEENANNKGIVD